MNLNRLFQQTKNIYHGLQSQWWRAWYRWPDLGLNIYGVTGTDGKTTTAIFLAAILQENFGRASVGLLSTERIYIGDEVKTNSTHMTTLNSHLVYQYLRTMHNRGVKHLVLELTSHALDQNRVAGIRLSGAIITNITHEHLDYHKTMSAYADAKGKIVRYLKSKAPLVANADDKWTLRIINKLRSQNENLNVIEVTAAQAESIHTFLPGEFNQANAAAASTLAQAVGINHKKISEGLARVKQVPGRMEWIELPNKARVLIDFALTPSALEHLYRYLRSEVSGKIYAVYGAAGRRDRTKRPLQSRVIARFADEIVVTQDEPYTEPEEQIYTDLEAGLEGFKVPWQRISDRREALRYALKKASQGDAVVITGMGNFTTRVVGTEHIPWNDRNVVQQLISELTLK